MLKRLLGAEPEVDGAQAALVRASGEALSYAELARAVARGAGQLERAGAGEGMAVAIGVADGAGFLVAALAAWEAGAAVVPLDLRAGAALAEEVATRAHASLVVRAASDQGVLQLEERAGAARVDAHTGLLLFTSGSSGRPKGVLLGRAGLRANVDGILGYLPVKFHPRTALTLPLAYSYALVGQALATLRSGATLLLLGELGYPALQLEAMVRLKASGLSSVPAALRLYSRAIAEGAARPALGYVASAGAPLDAKAAEAVRAAFPGARLFNQYGLTEASPRVAAIEDGDEAFARGAAGRPLPGVSVWAEGGELWVSGASVMLGYLDDLAATARALRSDGALRTGDLGHVDETGAIFVSGRADGVVKVAGERVGLEEVAERLREAGARDAAVVAVADEALGARLVAFVELDEAALPALRIFLRERLPPAKRPSKLHAVAALPRLPSGKIDRLELARRAAAP